jgi:DNA-binding beta-propeller fold protein YncE
MFDSVQGGMMRRAIAIGSAAAVALVLLVAVSARASVSVAPSQGANPIFGYVTNPTAVVSTPDALGAYVADQAGIEKWGVGWGGAGVVVNPDHPVDGLALSSTGLLYAAEAGASRVSVMDTSTNEVVRRVPMYGKAMNPVAVVVSPDETILYVASTTAQSVSAVNAITGAVEHTIPSPAGLRTPSALTRTPDGSKLFVADAAQGTVWSVDTATDHTSVTIAGLSSLKAIAVSVDSRTLYVAVAGDTPAVDSVDVARGTIVYSTPLAGAPTAIALAQDRELLVADPSDKAIDLIEYGAAPQAVYAGSLDYGVVAPSEAHSARFSGVPAVVGYTDEVIIQPLPTGVTATYQWYADGKPIWGATSNPIRLTADEIGAVMSVNVTTHAVGLAQAPAPDFFTDANPLLATMFPTKPSITGRVAVGRRVRARIEPWGRHTKVHFSYQWYAGSKPIRGATGTSLRIKHSSKGHKLRLHVTGKEYRIRRDVFSAYTKKVAKRR